MVSKSTLAMLELTCIEDYFEYIMSSKEKGQDWISQDLFNQLSDKQRDDFFDWVEVTYYYEAQDQGEQMLTEMQNLRKYFTILLCAILLSSCFATKRGCPDTWHMGGYTKTTTSTNQTTK